ncbi:hypothetical protein R1sor_026749 [Riccia sorocarpa]|uniref:Reverse transcriptase zinc-binding domain-containing protein n=1 Tax=Riccia sorocarpa TaxID=122646 RepID=A0ABD3GDZ8_9MARC
MSGKGGVLIAVNPSFAPFIVNNGVLPLERGLWLHIDTHDGRRLGFAAIYAPHTSTERSQLWAALQTSLDPSRKWILAGDFNMIIDRADQAGGNPKPIAGEEEISWTALMETLDLSDTFKRRNETLRFTWDNRRLALLLAQPNSPNISLTNGGRVLKRLDRFYAESSLLQNHVSTDICTASELSDHLPVIATFRLTSSSILRKTNYRMNISALKDQKLKQQLSQLWLRWQNKYEATGTPPLQALKGCIKRTAKFCQLWGKKAALKKKEKQNRLSLKVQGLTLQLQADPSNVYTQLKLEAALTELRTSEEEKARWIQNHLDRKWEEDGDRSTKLFFNTIKARIKQTAILAIQDPNGVLHSDQDHMLQLAADYFAEILHEPTQESHDPQERAELQEFLSRVQNQLHSTVFLCNEAMHEAKLQQIDTVFVKIDFRKASDMIRWDFLFSAMRAMNFGETFISFVSTLYSEATSNVRVNNSYSKDFDISRHRELQSIGTHYTQGYFADDAHLLLLAEKQNLLNAKQVLHSFGTVSGLTVQWDKSRARWISTANPRPPWLLELDWVWADENQPDKMLGFHFTNGLNEEAIFSAVFSKIEAKGGTANNSSRHRVAEVILHQKKQDGGLGLLSIQAQAQAFVAKLIRWTFTPGQHPLKAWVQAAFESVANLRWGASHLTWMSTPSKGSWPPMSPLMLHICKVWQATAKFLGPMDQLPLLSWKKLEIWGPKTAGVRNMTRSATRGFNARLKLAGIQELGDLTDDGSTYKDILRAATPNSALPPAACRAYNKVVESTPKHSATYRRPFHYVTTLDRPPTWCFKLKDEAPTDITMINTSHAKAAYLIQLDALIPAPISMLPEEVMWTPAQVASFWVAKKKAPDRFLLDPEDRGNFVADLQWQDQSGFLSAPNATIRKLASTDTRKVHSRLAKWEHSHHFDPRLTSIWSKLWKPSKPVKFSVLQWLIFFQAVPTNTWRHPQAPRGDEDTWCICCSSRAAEDIDHLFWRCPSVTPIWTWALEVLHLAFPETRTWNPSFRHAILAADLPDHCKPAAAWWEKWRTIVIWTIWLQRNGKTFRNAQPSLQRAKAVAWHRLLNLTSKEWERHCSSVALQDLTLARRAELDQKVARKLALINLQFRTTGHRLSVSWRPP